jgi:glycine/D-amino acid oxidase-like deaminating enzyme
MARDSEVVIIGAGAIGTAVAYSLAKAGKTDVLLIEKGPAVATVTSAQAAGLVGQVRSSVDRIRLAMWSVRTFSALERDATRKPSWRQVGSLRIAQTAEREGEFRRMKAVCDAAGLDVELIDAKEAERLWPGLRLDAARAILWCPSDGYLQPYDLAATYLAEARALGVRFMPNTLVTGFRLEAGAVTGVETDHGPIRCDTVINAAGQHAWHIAHLAGLELPIVPVRHEYLVTVPLEGIRPDFPCYRLPDATLYGRPDVNALLLGGWEPAALSVDPRSYDLVGEAPPIAADWPVLGNFVEQLQPFFEPVAEAGVRHVFSGWPTFTPDGRFIIGPSARLHGLVMAGGCNAHGVSGSAGIGRHVVESFMEPDPSPYVRSLSPDRFTEGASWDWATARRQAQRIYETYYHVGH